MSGTMVRAWMAAAGLAALAGAAGAQTCTPMDGWDCPPNGDCEVPPMSSTVRGEEEVWYPPEEGPVEFARDRRPMIAVFTWWNGNGYDHNPFGLHPSWWTSWNCAHSATDCAIDDDENNRPDQFDWLLGRLDDAYARGYRRIMLYLPAGEPYQTPAVPASQWWPMSDWRRAWFEKDTQTMGSPGGVAWWIANHDAEISIYQGYPIGDPCLACFDSNAYSTPTRVNVAGPTAPAPIYRYFAACNSAPTSQAPSTQLGSDTQVMRQNIQPWVDIGVTTFWFDAAGYGPFTPEFSQFAWDPDYTTQGVKFGGEAFALIDPPSGRNYPDEYYFDGMPWIMLLDTAEQVYNNGRTLLTDTGAHFWDAEDGWEGVIWPTSVPVLAAFEDPLRPVRPDWTPGRRYWSMYNYYVAKGFTLTDGYEYAERIFGFGHIANLQDFNGDGSFNSQDYMDFMSAWTISGDYIGRHPTDAQPLTFIHGDVNNSGTIDSQDFFDYLDAYLSSTPVPVDLGVMHWDPNSEWLPTEDDWINN